MQMSEMAVHYIDDNLTSPRTPGTGLIWHRFYNGTGSTIAAGVPLALDLTDYTAHKDKPQLGDACKPTATSGAANVCVGINLESCPDKSWGKRVVRGRVDSVPVTTSLAAGALLVGSTGSAAMLMVQPTSLAATTRPVAQALSAESGGTASVFVFA